MDDWKKNVKWLLVFILLIVCVITIVIAHPTQRTEVTVAFLDVGQGDAIYIEAPNGNQLLVDGGGTNAVLRELGAVMPWFDRTLDVVLATHPDADHIGGLVDLFLRYRVETFIDNGVDNDTAPFRALMSAVSHEDGLTRVTARRGMHIVLGGGVQVQVLFPDRSMDGAETNTGSIILKLTYGESSVLLTGDAPSAIEEYLISLDGTRLDVDVLKLGHHGSKTSSAESFIMATSPDVAIISAGADNRYGHPHQEVLKTLEVLRVPYRSTAQEGRIVLKLPYRTESLTE